MNHIKLIAEIAANMSIYINALFFFPQAIKIVTNKSAAGLSLLTFFGINVIQLSMVIHAYFIRDLHLFLGMGISLLISSTITCLILVYKEKGSHEYN